MTLSLLESLIDKVGGNRRQAVTMALKKAADNSLSEKIDSDQAMIIPKSDKFYASTRACP